MVVEYLLSFLSYFARGILYMISMCKTIDFKHTQAVNISTVCVSIWNEGKQNHKKSYILFLIEGRAG